MVLCKKARYFAKCFSIDLLCYCYNEPTLNLHLCLQSWMWWIQIQSLPLNRSHLEMPELLGCLILQAARKANIGNITTCSLNIYNSLQKNRWEYCYSNSVCVSVSHQSCARGWSHNFQFLDSASPLIDQLIDAINLNTQNRCFLDSYTF